MKQDKYKLCITHGHNNLQSYNPYLPIYLALPMSKTINENIRDNYNITIYLCIRMYLQMEIENTSHNLYVYSIIYLLCICIKRINS